VIFFPLKEVGIEEVEIKYYFNVIIKRKPLIPLLILRPWNCSKRVDHYYPSQALLFD